MLTNISINNTRVINFYFDVQSFSCMIYLMGFAIESGKMVLFNGIMTEMSYNLNLVRKKNRDKKSISVGLVHDRWC